MSLVPYRRGGSRGMGDPSVNVTTFWTPSTGYLNVPGDLSQGYQFKPQVTSVYDVPGLLLPAPACVQANAGAFVSASCVDQALAVQQQNFQRTADYNAGILQLPVSPAASYVPPVAPAAPAAPSAPATPSAGYVNPSAGPSASPAAAGPVGGSYVADTASFFESNVPIAGFNIPVWELAGAAVLALFLLRGR